MVPSGAFLAMHPLNPHLHLHLQERSALLHPSLKELGVDSAPFFFAGFGAFGHLEVSSGDRVGCPVSI